MQPVIRQSQRSTFTGTFHSRARNRTVGYTLAYPPGHDKGSELPLLVDFHPYGGNHRTPYAGLPLAHALAVQGATGPMLPMAMVSADGGKGYWHPLPGDDPMAMVVDELLPMWGRLGLGLADHGVASTGISMGGYGAILMAEQAHDANPTAYSSAANFDAYCEDACAAVEPSRSLLPSATRPSGWRPASTTPSTPASSPSPIACPPPPSWTSHTAVTRVLSSAPKSSRRSNSSRSTSPRRRASELSLRPQHQQLAPPGPPCDLPGRQSQI